jgi:hypothetical protein
MKRTGRGLCPTTGTGINDVNTSGSSAKGMKSQVMAPVPHFTYKFSNFLLYMSLYL